MATGLELAVIGLACRFPGARNPAEFWRNLRTGTESITYFTVEELIAAGADPTTVTDPAYVRAQGLLPDAELFDAEFFGISPKEATAMDPQQRVLLECAWEALEDSGNPPGQIADPVGVFAGTYYNSYLPALPPVVEESERFARNIANEKDYVATRLAYKLDLTGPAVTVQTACSTSLVAIHLAGQALLSGGCDLALAGGATVRAPHITGYQFQPGGIFSSDGHCRSFDAAAEGTVASNGAGVVVLKRLADAIADGDHIYATILGSAIGNDGADRIGYTAPGVSGQTRVIQAALAMAEVDPATIAYVETHGSATPLGDPIEVEALTRAYRRAPLGNCAIGSVKTNIGHTHAAAGVAGFMKTVLSMYHGLIPASLNFERPNPAIDFGTTPFFVNTNARAWPEGERRAGVSSFGMGGTGAHVLLAAPPSRSSTVESSGWRLLPLSARNPEALDAATDRLAAHLDTTADDLGSIAQTLGAGRRAFAQRRIVVASTPGEAGAALARREVLTGTAAPDGRRVAFMFSGLGDQHPAMGAGLYQTQPAFRAAVDECCELLRPLLGTDLRTVLFRPSSASSRPSGEVDLRAMLGRRRPAAEAGAEPLAQTRLAQPAVFVLEYALAQLWRSYGIQPDALIGYSIGEYVAACQAGVFSLADALKLVVARAELIEGLAAGGMIAVGATPEQLTGYVTGEVAVAAVNSPSTCVLAGPATTLDEVYRRLTEDRFAVRPLITSHAFHSPMMAAIVEPFVELIAGFDRQAPTIPYVSNVTGTWTTPEQATDPAFWGRHLREAVQFSAGVATLWQDPGRLLLELGPGQTLSSLALQSRPPDNSAAPVQAVASLPGAFDPQPEDRFLLGTAGKLWLAGVTLDWSGLDRGLPRRRVSLPTYPFQRQRHWAARTGAALSRPVEPVRSLEKLTDLSRWFHVPTWAPLPPHPARPVHPVQARAPYWPEHGKQGSPIAERPQRWLLILDRAGVGQQLAEALTEAGHEVLTSVDQPVPLPEVDHIVHLTNVDDGATLETSYFAVTALARAIATQPSTSPVDLAVITAGLQRVTGGETGSPVQATVLGPVRVLPLEHPHISSRTIDIVLPAPRRLIDNLLAELLEPEPAPVTALRDGQRWRPEYQPVRLPEVREEARNHLIIGGLGGIGLTLAREYAAQPGTGLGLLARTASRNEAVQELEALGARVVVRAVDVTDETALRTAAAEVAAEIGPIDHIVHAAGVAGGGLIQLRTDEAARAVLAPKVLGGLAVARLATELGASATLCSSVLALAGGVGQVDYVAANAFLDALAQHHPKLVSVNWDAWQEVGMAYRNITPAEPRVGPVAHPLLDACLTDTADHAVYTATFSAATSWLVDEHRMLGDPVVPGTGHLELARAAYAHLVGASAVELRDVRFFTPAVLAEHEVRQLHIVFDKTTTPMRFTVVSRYGDHPATDAAGAAGKTWQVHAAGQVAPAAPVKPARQRPPAELVTELVDRGKPEVTPEMLFGPRSLCLRHIWSGEKDAVALLELPEAYADDLDQLGLHPSIMDISAGFVGMYLAEDFRIPISYGRLRHHGRLPRRVYSHHRYHEVEQPGQETVTADFTLSDEDGRVLVEVEGFVLKRAPRLRETLDQARDASAEVAFFEYPRAAPVSSGLLATHLANGIRPAEGAEALRRLTAAQLGPQVIVVAKDLPAVLADMAGTRLDPDAAIHTERPAPHPRPNVLTPYRAPTDPLEGQLAGIWQDLLGVAEVGVDDSFVELGGHSLLGLEMVNQLRRQLGIDVSLSLVFTARTVAELADRLRDGDHAQAGQGR